jgi:hypothetical protein
LKKRKDFGLPHAGRLTARPYGGVGMMSMLETLKLCNEGEILVN